MLAPGDVQRLAGERTHEVDADRRDVGFRVGVVGEPQEQAGLANTGVPDEEELEEIVVSADGQHSRAPGCIKMAMLAWGYRKARGTLGHGVSTDP